MVKTFNVFKEEEIFDSEETINSFVEEIEREDSNAEFLSETWEKVLKIYNESYINKLKFDTALKLLRTNAG